MTQSILFRSVHPVRLILVALIAVGAASCSGGGGGGGGGGGSDMAVGAAPPPPPEVGVAVGTAAPPPVGVDVAVGGVTAERTKKRIAAGRIPANHPAVHAMSGIESKTQDSVASRDEGADEMSRPARQNPQRFGPTTRNRH